ncbi:hypothetical protein GCM10010149_47560 [Nonomuraea roseoviolacea subsp. roseoviolacea]|uniref:phage tail protein n=1 Tax=Nonomuraea roseoviolacea TaxID=103837 RepID=UPI0031CF1D43
MVQTKVGEAYVEIKPKVARDFGKQLRDQLERQLKPFAEDLGRNVGNSLGDSIGENFAARFGDHARTALDDIEFSSKGSTIGERLGDEFGDGFSDQARERITGFGRDIEVDLRTSFTRVSEVASKSGRDIELNLTRHLSGALSSARGLATGFGQLASSAVLTAGSLATAGGALGVAAQGALALGAALAPATGIFAALPGAALLGAGAIGTLKVAFSGLGDAFKAALGTDFGEFAEEVAMLPEPVAMVAYEVHGLSGLLEQLRRNVQSSFFAPLIGEVMNLRDVIPAVEKGMVGVAGVFSEAAREVIRFTADAQTVWSVEYLFDSLRESVSAFIPSIRILLEGFRDLGVIGADFLASLAPGIARAATSLGLFAYHAAGSGDALRWMQNAVAVFKQLGAIVADVGGIVSALFRAMSASGNDALGVIGKLVDGMHRFLDSAQGQQVLISIFSALSRIGSALLPVVLALANALGGLAPTIAQIAELVGPILTTAINALAPALATLGPALVSVFVELGKAVTILAESGALQSIATALAAILVAVAPLLPPVAQLISLLAQGLAYVITTFVAPALQTLVTWIGDAVRWLTGEGLTEDTWLSRVITFIYNTVAPLFQQAGEIISRVFNDLVRWFTENQSTVQDWGEKIKTIITTVGQIISGVFEFISIAWDKFGGPLLDLIGNIFTGILDVVSGIMTAIKGIIETILGVITGDWDRAWNGVKMIFEGVWNALVAIARTIWNNLLIQFKAVLAQIDDNWEKNWAKVERFAKDIWNSIVDWIKRRISDIGTAIEWFASLPGKISTWFGSAKDAAIRQFDQLLAWIRGVPGAITSVFANAGSWLYNAGREIVNGLWNGIVSLWNWVVANWNNMVTNLINIVKNILGIASPSKVMHEMGAFLVQGLARGISKTASVATDAIAELAASTVDAWGSPELAVTAWSTPEVARRTPGTTRPAGDGLATDSTSGRYRDVSVTVNAAPTVPTERQIVTALGYADALYA